MVDLSDTSSSGIDALFKDLKYDEAKREIFEYEVKDPVTGLPTGNKGKRNLLPLHLMEHFKSQE